MRDPLENRLIVTLLLFWLVTGACQMALAAGASQSQYSLWDVDDFKPTPAVAVPLYPSPTRETISLDGTWQVKTDPEEQGFAENWFARQDLEFPDRLRVPGNWNAQGLGGPGVPHDEGAMYPELSMRTATLKGSYVGLAWYRKRVRIPSDWRDRQVRLVFGGALNSVRLWVNGHFVGGRWTDGNSFYFDVTQTIEPGRVNSFVMAFDSRWKETATLSHLYWYVSTGGPYHHIVLHALQKVHIEQAIVRPLLPGPEGPGIAEVHITAMNDSGADADATVEAEILSCQDSGRRFRAASELRVPAGQRRTITLPVRISPVETWSWNCPNLYKLTVHLSRHGAQAGAGFRDCFVDRFGMRTVASVGNRFELNGHPTFILGQHFNFFWPNTLTPPITKQEYLKHLKLMKDYGFNYLRTPWLMPEECYQAADELGMMLQLEFPYAFGEYTKIKLPLVKRLIQECLLAYGNHPSLVLLCMSNEGSWDGAGGLNAQFCAFAKSLDPSRLVMDTDGTPGEIPGALLADVVSLANMTAVWGDYLRSVATTPDIYHLRPCIDHEFLNVPTLYNPEVVRDYRRAVLRPPQELVPKLSGRIRSQGMEGEYSHYVRASHRLQADFIKEGMEGSRKNPLKAGYSMCAWNDIEANVHWGILDAFMNPKGIRPDEMRAYNAQSVLLVDFIDPTSGDVQLVPDYCRTYDQGIVIQPYASYWGHEPVTDASLTWQIQAESGKLLAQGKAENLALASYTVTTLPRVLVPPIQETKPQEVILRMRLSSSGVALENSWPLWFFPPVRTEEVGRRVFASAKVISALHALVANVLPPDASDDPSSLWVTDEPALAQEWLQAGKNVLFLAAGGAVSNPFDTGWFKGDGHVGTIVRPNPILGEFPHQGFASWQFRNLIDRAADVPEAPIEGTPIITSVLGESWPHLQHQLFVANAQGGGHLTYCLLKVLSGRCEANYLLLQLLRNVNRLASDPVMPTEQVRALLKDQ